MIERRTGKRGRTGRKKERERYKRKSEKIFPKNVQGEQETLSRQVMKYLEEEREIEKRKRKSIMRNRKLMNKDNMNSSLARKQKT